MGVRIVVVFVVRGSELLASLPGAFLPMCFCLVLSWFGARKESCSFSSVTLPVAENCPMLNHPACCIFLFE